MSAVYTNNIFLIYLLSEIQLLKYPKQYCVHLVVKNYSHQIKLADNFYNQYKLKF